jgi:hypothetical protein
VKTVFGGIVLRVNIEAGLALTMASRMGENDEDRIIASIR